MEDNPYFSPTEEQNKKIKAKMAKFVTLKKMKVHHQRA